MKQKLFMKVDFLMPEGLKVIGGYGYNVDTAKLLTWFFRQNEDNVADWLTIVAEEALQLGAQDILLED
jgi:hypothetical protein